MSEICGCILSLLSDPSPSSPSPRAPVSSSGETHADWSSFSNESSSGAMSFFSSDSFLMRPAAAAAEDSCSPVAKKMAQIHSLPRRSLSKICKLAGDAAVGKFFCVGCFVGVGIIRNCMCTYVLSHEDIVGSDMLSELQEPGIYSMFSGGLGLPLSDMHSSMYWRVKEAGRDAESSEEEDEI